MTPEEKAEELFGKFAMYLRANLRYDEEANEDAKQCASIAVDEILKSKKQNIIHFYRCGDEFCECGGYWQEVTQEIELL